MNFMIYPLGCLGFLGLRLRHRLGQLVQRPGAAGLVRFARPRPVGAERRHRHRRLMPSAADVFKYGLLGTKGFFLHGVDDVSVMALFFFMMVFMDTTATIPTGAMAERWTWKNFCLYGCWVALPYCIYANWVWGGGWLAQAGKNWGLGHGAVDFAGSGVVHAMGGIICPGRLHRASGRASANTSTASRRPLPGHNIPMVVIGTFILAFGWFGFNPGSTLSGTDLRIASSWSTRCWPASPARLACDVLHDAQRHEARSLDDVQRHAGRPGGHHGSLCVCR